MGVEGRTEGWGRVVEQAVVRGRWKAEDTDLEICFEKTKSILELMNHGGSGMYMVLWGGRYFELAVHANSMSHYETVWNRARAGLNFIQ